jgi:hypothetical protein
MEKNTTFWERVDEILRRIGYIEINQKWFVFSQIAFIAILSSIFCSCPLFRYPALVGTRADRLVTEEKLIAGMQVGEAGYTVPWCLSIDAKGKPWLDKYTVVHRRHYGGTSGMLVIRTKDGYDVDASKTKCARNWQWENQDREDFEKDRWIPVISFTH